jgi:hypothetical protein
MGDGPAFEPIATALRQPLAALVLEAALEYLTEAPNLAAASAASARARLVAPLAAVAAHSPI